MSYHELRKLYGEPIKEIRGAESDVAKIIVGEEPPYQSIRVSGDRLTVERGPAYTEETSLTKTTGADEREARQTVKETIEAIEDEHGSAPIREVVETVIGDDIDQEAAFNQIEELRKKGDVYEAESGELRTV
jgi:DNA replicative helicase MCM subunit Mcm2 (Cdc46/Mcm family)